MSKEFRVGHGGVIECNMIVHWPIEVLSVASMPFVVIFGAFHIKVGDPAQLAINVSIL